MTYFPLQPDFSAETAKGWGWTVSVADLTAKKSDNDMRFKRMKEGGDCSRWVNLEQQYPYYY